MDKWLQKVRKRLLTNFALETDSPTRLNFVNQLLRPQMTVLEAWLLRCLLLMPCRRPPRRRPLQVLHFMHRYHAKLAVFAASLAV